MRKKSTNSGKSEETIPLMVYETSATSVTRTRRNAGSTTERTDRFKNINDGLVPFKYGGTSYGKHSSSLNVRDAVLLCQKAYYNYPSFRNVIDLMTEFSVGNVYFKGGSKKSREFFEALFKKINLWSIQEKFFREYYRSGNVFVYRFDAILQPEDVKKISRLFGASISLVKKNAVPSRYVFLNPADIEMSGTLSFHAGVYFKTLSDFELERLRSPRTEEDQEVFDSLDSKTKEAIRSKENSVVRIPLDMDRTLAIFYKKQDYEPFSVPMGYPVLEDLNFKHELKKMDMAIGRTMQQAILMVTMGSEPEKGGINQKNLLAMQNLFENQSVGRVLVADYTTKAEFVVPRIADLLDPKKYEIFERDINAGLNNILIGGEKFANQESKVKVFIARLDSGRQAFVQDFLLPEIKKVSKNLGFRNFPTPFFQEISLSDNVLRDKIYTRLFELGALTPEETFQAIKTKRLPDFGEMLENQKKHKKEGTNKGLFESPIKKMSESPKPPAGRPDGTKNIKQETYKISPVGTPSDNSKAAEEAYSLSALKDNMILAQKLQLVVEKALKKIHDRKRLTKDQRGVAGQITEIIIVNEDPKDWVSSAEEYCKSPVDKNDERVKEVRALAERHDLDFYLSSLLFASKKEN